MAENSITPKALKARLDAGEKIRVIDVRDDWELAITKLDFADHIPMDEIASRADEISEDEPIVLMCRTGHRSERVLDYFTSMGYDNVLNLEGGILQWAAEVDPTLPRFYE